MPHCGIATAIASKRVKLLLDSAELLGQVVESILLGDAIRCMV
jgi:hypothetical protein